MGESWANLAQFIVLKLNGNESVDQESGKAQKRRKSNHNSCLGWCVGYTIPGHYVGECQPSKKATRNNPFSLIPTRPQRAMVIRESLSDYTIVRSSFTASTIHIPFCQIEKNSHFAQLRISIISSIYYKKKKKKTSKTSHISLRSC